SPGWSTPPSRLRSMSERTSMREGITGSRLPGVAVRPRFTWLAVFLLLVVARLDAQSATAAIAAGDRESDAFRSVQALEHYEAAIALDSTSAEAYGKASRTLVDLGEVEANSATRAELFERATRY